MIGEITNNLVNQFNDNFGRNNKMEYPKGGVSYTDRGNNSKKIIGLVTYGEQVSNSYTPANLISVSNNQGDFSSGGKMFAAYSSSITTYVNRGNQKTSNRQNNNFRDYPIWNFKS